MIQYFKKGETIKPFQTENGKVHTTISLNGFNITNPTIEQFKETGWEEYVYPTTEPAPYVPTLEELVESKIRERYSINQEFEVNRKRDTDPDAFNTYYDYVEQCIEQAKAQLVQ